MDNDEKVVRCQTSQFESMVGFPYSIRHVAKSTAGRASVSTRNGLAAYLTRYTHERRRCSSDIAELRDLMSRHEAKAPAHLPPPVVLQLWALDAYSTPHRDRITIQLTTGKGSRRGMDTVRYHETVWVGHRCGLFLSF